MLQQKSPNTIICYFVATTGNGARHEEADGNAGRVSFVPTIQSSNLTPLCFSFEHPTQQPPALP